MSPKHKKTGYYPRVIPCYAMYYIAIICSAVVGIAVYLY